MIKKILAGLVILSTFIVPSIAFANGIDWELRSSAVDNNWNQVTYGNGVFVAISNSGTGNRVMTSPDGITWTLRTTPADNNWIDITYGNGVFVAVAPTGTGDRVMTSGAIPVDIGDMFERVS